MMKLIITLSLCFTFLLGNSNLLVGNDVGRDFLITLNGSKLTGDIKDISFSNTNSILSFENDLGSIYQVHASTIFGFSFEEKGEMFFYESKFLDGTWKFLKVEKQGKGVSMYKSSERQLKFTSSDQNPIVSKEKYTQIWLQFANEPPFKIYRLNFKSVLRKKMASYPEIVNRLGKRGFKYNDLSSIVELYNQFYEQ